MDTKTIVTNYWDKRSDSYKNGVNGFEKEERDIWENILQSYLDGQENLKVLDIGTGVGFLALLFAEMGHEVTAVDISEDMLGKAENNADKLGLDIKFHYADAEDLPFEDGYFDVVVNKYLLWTLPDPDKTIKEWKRVLKPDGRLMAIDGNWFDPKVHKRIKRSISKFKTMIANRKNFTLEFENYYEPIRESLPLYENVTFDKLYEILENSGFKEIETDPLKQVKDYQKKHSPFPDKFLKVYSYFLITGKKE